MAGDDLELTIRKGSPSVKLTRDEFRERFRAQFVDPAFERVTTELDAVEAIGQLRGGVAPVGEDIVDPRPK